ncbi:MAG: hypothetical protein CVT65_09300 [Actinobacteria bacterium HGW-Actinobacteria-5]|nr:MAG: hypothetical protein CVT65_09300 [Actinobacteria bacterium HGW-Actinobacteria-5]
MAAGPSDRRRAACPGRAGALTVAAGRRCRRTRRVGRGRGDRSRTRGQAPRPGRPRPAAAASGRP